MSNRDEFPAKTKTAVAMRAGWQCSFTDCNQPTAGPSEEAIDAVTMVGKAAHICGASPGTGSRRYDASMTSEQRSSISNAIWLCAHHADLIDRDDVTYTVEQLRGMKQNREAMAKENIRSRQAIGFSTSLFAIGPQIIFTGEIQTVTDASWTMHIRHFVAGDLRTLVDFIGKFSDLDANSRYLLCNELGDGRTITQAPVLNKAAEGYSLLCSISPSFPRIEVKNLGSDMAMHRDTGDLYLSKEGDIARVSGIDYLPQKIQTVLSIQQGENLFSPSFGVRFFEYYEAFKDSLWFERILMLEVIRQAAIPYSDLILKKTYTPLRCVSRVYGIEVLSSSITNHRLPLRITLEVCGVGRWERDISVYVPTREQMIKRAELAVSLRPLA